MNLYLLYKWFEELKAATKSDSNPILQLILCFIPLVNIYIIWKFMNDVEAAVKKKGKESYPMGATVFLIACIVLSPIMGLSMLYMLYKTQELMNLL